MITTKLEVLVDFGSKPDENDINRTLNVLRSQDGVKEASFEGGAILVETTLPNQTVLDIVEQSSGRRTVLQGFGDSQSAVAMVSSQTSNGALGVIRFQQGSGVLVADGAVDRLTPGIHGLHITSDGDLSQGCSSLGGHYNPTDNRHGGPGDVARHAGDLGNIVADETGRAEFRIVDRMLQLHEMIGRCVAVTERRDDLGRGGAPTSHIDGDAGPIIACGIIARSAGVFQNPKRVCQCDGVVVWDERDRPIAGAARRCCGKEKGDTKPCCKV